MNSDNIFLGIYKNLEIPIFIVDIAASGEFLFSGCNPAYERATGLQNKDLYGKRPEDISGISKESADALRAIFQNCLDRGEAIHFEEKLVVNEVETWWMIYLSPMRDEQGKIFRLIGSCIDVTEHRRTDELLRKSEEKYRTLYEESFDGLFITSPAGKILDMNKKGIMMFGYDTKEEILSLDLEKDVYAYPPDRKRILSMVNLLGSAEYDVTVKKKNGEKMITHCALTAVRSTSGEITSYRGIIRDISDHTRIENIMQARLRLLEFANSHSLDELLTATLDEIEALTESSIGFYHFLESDQKTLTLQNWSTNTLAKMCTAAGKGNHYNIAQAGVWVDCIHERRPVIHNDYTSLPHRKGMPEGHAPVNREVVVPIFRGKLIKAIIGVGNKLSNYDERDIAIVSQLGDLSWDITERKRAEEALRQSEERKSILNQIANIFLTFPDEEMYGEILAIVLRVMKSKFGVFGYIGENGDLITPSLTRDIWDGCQVAGKSIVFPSSAWGTSLWGQAIRERKTIRSDGPFHTPEGHIDIEHFLTSPIVYGKETFGLISVANKEGGYTGDDEDLLVGITNNISPILKARLQRDFQERERLLAEETLSRNERNLREAQRIAHLGSWELDLSTNILRWSDEVYQIFGLEPREFAASYEAFLQTVHPDDKASVDAAYMNSIQHDVPYDIVHRIIRRSDGKIRYVHEVCENVKDETGKVVRSLGTVHDITELKESEAAAHREQELTARIIESIPHSVFWKDRHYVYQGCNANFAREAGFESPIDVVGKTDRELPLTKEKVEQYQQIDEHVMDSGEAHLNIEETIHQAEGAEAQILSSKVPLREVDGRVIGILGIYADITPQKRMAESLKRSNRALRSLSACNQAVVRAKDEAELLQSICDLLVEVGNYKFAWIGEAQDDEKKTVRPVAAAGESKDYLNSITIHGIDDAFGRSPAGKAIWTCKTQVSRDIARDPQFVAWRDQALTRGYLAALSVPILLGERIYGSLNVYTTDTDAFDEQEIELLEELALDINFGLRALRTGQERDRANATLQATLLQTVEALALTVEKRDPYTAGHHKRVASLAVDIATEMKLNSGYIEGIRIAGTIHDIGKISVPSEILVYPGALDEIEMQLIRRHPQTGYQIMEGVKTPWPIQQMILQHHERLDGSGYPLGLKGEEIIIEARILAVADVVEAMATHRPYRPALTIDAALEEILSGKGVRYDSRAVDACVCLFREKGYQFEK